MTIEDLRKIIRDNFEEFDEMREAPTEGFVSQIINAVERYIEDERKER